MARRIVLDANIVVRAVLGVRVPEVIERYATSVSFFVPAVALAEATTHLPAIAAKRGVDTTALLEALDRFRRIVDVVPADVTAPFERAALARVGGRDPRDWPIVAAALALSCPVWTEDHDFFGAGVPTWTTRNVEVYLRGD